jgi:predicted phosphodiesterase
LRIWVLSDLHVESTRGWDLPPVGNRPNFDVLVIAGDLITKMERGVAWVLKRVADRPVFYLGGNHEFYGCDIDRTVAKARVLAAGTNVHVLQNDVVQINDPAGGGPVSFFGATGWTDFDLFGDPERGMRIAGDVMNDYRRIRINQYRQRLKPVHTLARHRETRAFLEQELKKPRSGRRVVATHMCFHAPEGIRAGHEDDPISVAYYSRAAIEGADLWIYGHSHETRDFMVGQGMGTSMGNTARVVSNGKGYGPWGHGTTWENKDFDPHFVVEI